ncbi:glycosyltransferase family 2 protein [Alteromonas sp. ASW11-19]|uniref:Glycosyltransferase family 2 protein n=1 Tax=Alteromonas salexigens TaxID=2982530 RepID=A0ABT2VPA4_9ALTE|nr:glycosyltransferase family 2 protein [Alteromonas salexigens]MCU7554904.1 glycosyltransferase family 2 protein [Alteromonas salexigens]
MIGAVIILYHPDIRHVMKMVEELKQVVKNVALIDNSPVASQFPADEYIDYLHFPDNLGIAEAQNKGIELIAAVGCDRVLILDQDSNITASIVERLADHLKHTTGTGSQVAAVGPMLICEFSNQQVKPRLQKAMSVNNNLAEVKQIIASGMLIPLSAYQVIGPKESALFIDGVDHEWCWRARQKGYKVYQALDVGMPHKQGDARRKILGLTFKQGSPVRLYYQVRNVLLLSRRSYVPGYWKCRHLLALPVRWAVNRWHFPEGKTRGRYFIKGFIDGLKGKAGRVRH